MNVQTNPERLTAGRKATINTKGGLVITGEVAANNVLARVLDLGDDLSIHYRAISTVSVEADPRWSKPGVYVYYSYGVDDNGHMVDFPNILVRNGRGEWWVTGNVGGYHKQLEEDEVPYASMLPLTIHPDYVNSEA